MIKIIYPERRGVLEETIEGWYADAVANGDCASGMDSIFEKALELQDAGLITLAKDWRLYTLDELPPKTTSATSAKAWLDSLS